MFSFLVPAAFLKGNKLKLPYYTNVTINADLWTFFNIVFHEISILLPIFMNFCSYHKLTLRLKPSKSDYF